MVQSKHINLCYGAFFKVLSAFKKESINDWQLHNRLMNIDDIPFGEDESYSVGSEPIILIGARKGERIDNPFQTINEYSNCTKTKTLPIQRPGKQRRFMEQYQQAKEHNMALEYIKKYILRYLSDHERLTKAIIELLCLAHESSIPASARFYIDADTDKMTTADEIRNARTDFDVVSLVAGVFHYIVVNCTDNTVGNKPPNDVNGIPGSAIKEWKKSISVPQGNNVTRNICIVDDNVVKAKSETGAREDDAPSGQPVSAERPEIDIDSEFFNLFVIGFYDPDEPMFDSGRFVMPTDRALREYVSDEVKSTFTPLTKDAIAHIKRLPSIFACENRLRDYPGQEAYYGFVTEVKPRENGVNVYFRIERALSQQALNDIDYLLAVHKCEFSRTHWSIKNINLLEELADAGLLAADGSEKSSDGHLTVRSGQTSLPTDIHKRTKLTTLSLPESMISLSERELGSLSKCGELIAIMVSPDNPSLVSSNGSLFSRKTNTLKLKLLKAPPAFIGEYVIDDSADEIGKLSFAGCGKINRIVIPGSVAYIHEHAFSGCNGLEEVVFKDCKAHIEDEAFRDCPSLKKFVICGEASPSLSNALNVYNCHIAETPCGR
jgi:hypothetical protein